MSLPPLRKTVSGRCNSGSDIQNSKTHNENDEDGQSSFRLMHKESSDQSSHSLEDEQTRPIEYASLTMDGDVLQRIKSRASILSEQPGLKELHQKYRDGLYFMEPDDVQRPQNWSLRKRLAHTVAFGITTLTAQLGASALSPGIEHLSRDFNVGVEVGTLAFCVYLMGNMLGPVLFAPISELYGRKLGVLVPCFIGGVLQCVCANVDNIASLIVFRFLAGVFGGAPIAAAGGAMADMWNSKQRAAAMVLYACNIVIGASGSPTLGALLITTGDYGWRWILWLGGLMALTVSTFNLIMLDETFLPVIEQRAARRVRLETGYWGLHSEHDKWSLTTRELFTVHLVRPIFMMITPIVALMITFSSFVFGLLYILITSVGIQYQKNYNFSIPGSYCPLFGFCIGYFIGSSANILQSIRYARMAEKLGHNPAPEERLPAMMLLGWLLPSGMFVYGWCMRPDIHWMGTVIGLGMVGGGLSVIFQGCLVYLTDVYTKYAASAIAANTMLRSIFGGVFPLFARQMFNTLNVNWGASLLGFIGFALVPVPWIFYIIGHKVRQRDPFKKRLAM